MKRFIRFASNIYKKQETKIAMTSNRFFLNKHPDFNEACPDTTEIPEVLLKFELNSMIETITTQLKPVELNGEGGLYLGTTGVSYMFYHLSKVPSLQDKRNTFLSEAVDYLTPSLIVAQKSVLKKKDVPSFILGNCGVYAVAAVVYHATGDRERSDYFRKLYYQAADTCKDLRFLTCGSDELFVGRAGYICGALWLAKETNTNLQLQDLHEISRVMIASGREYAIRHQSACPLMYSYYEVEYLGAAHGLCSILHMLMSVPHYLDSNPQDAKAVKDSVDYLLSLQDNEGNFPSATDDINQQHILVHWCHGGPGVIYLMAKAFLVWQDEKYLRSCERIAELIWSRGLLKKGPGICHGVAGNGYVFLLLYRLTSKPKYLHRALAFARFMEEPEFKRNARIPDYPFSLYEGIAGTACFLGDLTAPMQAAFPFFDIF